MVILAIFFAISFVGWSIFVLLFDTHVRNGVLLRFLGAYSLVRLPHRRDQRPGHRHIFCTRPWLVSTFGNCHGTRRVSAPASAHPAVSKQRTGRHTRTDTDGRGTACAGNAA